MFMQFANFIVCFLLWNIQITISGYELNSAVKNTFFLDVYERSNSC